jgi:3-oxoacyl-[acyl-carrier-protein] synthase II
VSGGQGTGRRVVVTGIGLVTPLGIGADANWAALMTGQSGVGRITRFDASRLPVQIAGEIPGFHAEQWIEKKEVKKMDLFIHYAIAAAQMAIAEAGLPTPLADPERTGVIVGVGIGGLQTLEESAIHLDTRRMSPFFIPRVVPNMAAGHIAMRCGAQGPNYATSSACASGAHALGDAYGLIRAGRQDVMIAGGAEAPVAQLAVGGFAAMRALASSFNDQPARASRPFDGQREGFVLGEGAGIMVLESLAHAEARGATILAEFAGSAFTCDAYHMTQPSPGGAGAARCMRLALADAECEPERVGYINAHGTSTQQNDAAETQAIKSVFGDHARKLAVSSTKSMTGHLLGAAGAVEAAYSVLALSRGMLPPTINLETPDPACDLDYVPNVARAAQVDVVLSNAFGFGGTNVTLAFQRTP